MFDLVTQFLNSHLSLKIYITRLNKSHQTCREHLKTQTSLGTLRFLCIVLVILMAKIFSPPEFSFPKIIIIVKTFILKYLHIIATFLVLPLNNSLFYYCTTA